MTADRLQHQRFELKYRVAPTQVPVLRDFLRGHLEPDAYGEGQPDGAYPVNSVYLDSPDLRLCRATINGDKNRFKLRLRYYEAGSSSPAFFEIKSRLNDCIRKKRVAVRRDAVAPLLAGAWPDPEHLAEASPAALDALQAIWHVMRGQSAAPQAHVGYRREAWVCPAGNSVRVTFDRAVRCAPWTTPDPGPPAGAVAVFGDDVILEVKFTDRFPRWVSEMVRGFGLVRGGAAKYVDGLARARNANGCPAAMPPAWAVA